MKKLGLILITLILAAGMVFAATELSSSDVKITGTITPYKPDGGITTDGLSIVWYVVEDKTNSSQTAPSSYAGGTITGTKEAISVDVRQETTDKLTKSLSLVFGAVCDVPLTTTNGSSITITVTDSDWTLAGKEGSVTTLRLDTVTNSLGTGSTTYPLTSTSSDSKLTWSNVSDDAMSNTGITVSATAGTNNGRTPELVGWTSVTWGPTGNANAVTAGNYNATITVAFTAD